MRILSVGNFLDRAWDGSITDETHIADALEQLGHQVLRVNRDNLGGEGWTNIDFVLISQWQGYHELFPKSLRYLNCPIVYWAYDHQDQNQEWHNRLIEGSDLYLSKRIADSKYANWQWLPQQFAPDFLDKYPGKVEKDIDVLFTGSYLGWAGERNETVMAVHDWCTKNGKIMKICSVNEWPFHINSPPVMDEKLLELYARSKINIAIDHTLEAGYWSDRAAQIMACGGFVLHRYVPLMESIFRQKIGYFYNIEDCLTKIESFLEMPLEDMETLADIGYEYAHEELMAINTVSNLLTIVDSIL